MLSALLPGVREFRTPLVTGALWAACLWLGLGSWVSDTTKTTAFIDRFHLGLLPGAVWLGAGVLFIYLLGSLLVVRKSPVERLGSRIRPRLKPILERLNNDRSPATRRHRLVWRIWRAKHGRVQGWSILRAVDRWCSDYGPDWTPVDEWLTNEYRAHAVSGRVPVMRNFEGGCDALTGFDCFYKTETVDAYYDSRQSDDYDQRATLAESFRWAIKNEKPAVEVRIQMRFPEVYAEIDRLKVEAELRMSIFWPLLTLSGLLAVAWSPFALALAIFPPFMLRDGFKRAREASERTWGTVVAGEVSTPILDAMREAQVEECRDFRKRYGQRLEGDERTPGIHAVS